MTIGGNLDTQCEWEANESLEIFGTFGLLVGPFKHIKISWKNKYICNIYLAMEGTLVREDLKVAICPSSPL